MDIHDVSSSERFAQLLLKQKEALRAASVRQGEQPKDRKSRPELVSSFMIYHIRRQFRMSSTLNMHTSFVPPSYQPSVAPLKELKQIYIKELCLETHHRGRFLLLRAITPPNRMTAVMTIVEDEMDDAAMLQLYQQGDRPDTSIIKENDVLFVKEPYFKVMADGNYGLRVDHVSDLVWLEPHDQRVPSRWAPRVLNLDKTADDWKLEGNDAMRRQEYWVAIQSYNMALGCSGSIQERKTLRLNRALAYLKNGCFDAALVDTDCLTPPSDAPEKALYRAAQALYKLGRFSECQEILTLLCKKFPNNGEAAAELTRVECRLKEQKCGIYDFKAIYEQISKLRPPHLDYATFTGPVAVRASKGRGRGLFTTKAVKAGDLILCEKAFAHCYADDPEKSDTITSKISLLISLDTNVMTMGTQSDLITTIVQKLWQNPSFLPEFTLLHHGSYKPLDVTEVDNKPIVDTFLIARIISLNVFGCPLSTLESHFKPTKADKYKHHSCGIWLKASYINHSCFSNARRSFIGDLQLVHATRDLPADTELTFWYQQPEGNYDKTQKLLRSWGFKCDCSICLDAINTPKKLLKRRETLLGDLKATALDPNSLDLAKAERLLSAAEQTYKSPASTVPRLALWASYLRLTRAHAKQGQAGKVMSLALKVLESLGFVINNPPVLSNPTLEVVQWGLMTDGVIETWVHLWTAYAGVAPRLAQKAEEYARISYRICVGEDVTFDETYGKDAREAIFS